MINKYTAAFAMFLLVILYSTIIGICYIKGIEREAAPYKSSLKDTPIGRIEVMPGNWIVNNNNFDVILYHKDMPDWAPAFKLKKGEQAFIHPDSVGKKIDILRSAREYLGTITLAVKER